MERSYLVSACGKPVGKVLVQRQGLYYLFSCRCDLTGDIIYRLTVTCGSVCESLGVLVPNDGCFMLETKQPVKRIGAGEMAFKLQSSQDHLSHTFIPIKADEPFAYISQLKESFLMLQGGQPGIVINEKQEQ